MSAADPQVSLSFHEKQTGHPLDDREGLVGP